MFSGKTNQVPPSFLIWGSFLMLLLLFFSLPGVALSQGELLTLKEVKTGMKGYGLTVISGVSIERFDVQVLGLLQNSKLSEALVISGNSILVRVEGEDLFENVECLVVPVIGK